MTDDEKINDLTNRLRWLEKEVTELVKGLQQASDESVRAAARKAESAYNRA